MRSLLGVLVFGFFIVTVLKQVYLVDAQCRLVMQGDGNIVLYSGASQVVWASNTDCARSSTDSELSSVIPVDYDTPSVVAVNSCGVCSNDALPTAISKRI